MKQKNTKIKNQVLSVASLLFLASIFTPAHAVPTSVTGNGVVWSLSSDAVSGVSTSASFTLSVDGSLSTLGNNAYLNAFSLKNFGSDVTVSNLVAPWTITNSWDWVNDGLNGKGCKTKLNVTEDSFCAYNDGLVTNAPVSTNSFSITFDVSLDPGSFPDYTHLKVRWVDANGDKLGDLISQDIDWTTTTVPEPSLLALLGLGLAGFGLRKLGKRQIKA